METVAAAVEWQQEKMFFMNKRTIPRRRGWFFSSFWIISSWFESRRVQLQLLNVFQSGAILGQRFQPHEAHIPFTLQFMMDYNVYGMSFITLEKVKYRRSPSNPGKQNRISLEWQPGMGGGAPAARRHHVTRDIFDARVKGFRQPPNGTGRCSCGAVA